MDDKINILFIVPDLKREGAQTQLVELANGLDNTVFTKHLLTLEKEQELLDKLDREHIAYYNIQRTYKYDLIAVAKKIASIIDNEKIDVVHCTLQFSILFGWLAKKFSKRKPKLIAALHTTQNRSTKEDLQDKYIYNHLLKSCDKVIFVCENQKAVWIKRFPHLSQKSIAIHNGVDVERFSRNAPVSSDTNYRVELGIPEDARVISCLAAFRPEKGHSYLLDAVAMLDDDIHLMLAGGGEKLEEFKQRVAESDISGRVHFLGNVADVRTVLRETDVCVLASTAVETFSIAMLEAMAMGVPVVATRLGGMDEAVMPGKSGALAEPGNTASLKDALESVIGDKGKAAEMGAFAQKLVADRFTKEGMIAKTEQLVSSVCS